MVPAFVPSNGPLVVRTSMGTVPENQRKTHHLPTTKKDFAGAKPKPGANTRFGQLSQSSFFARHNPQPARVRHIKGIGLLDIPICAVHDEGYVCNPRLSLRRPATHGGEDLSLRWSYPLPGPRTAPAGGRLLPINSVNYHPNHINPALQKHQVNWLDASKNYRRFPLSLKERADPKFGMSLLDIPICAVHDDGYITDARYSQTKRPYTTESAYERYKFRNPRLSRHKLQFYSLNETLNSHRYPINTITGLSMFPMGYRERASTSYGMIPITDSWRDELRELTEKAGLGQPIDVKEQPKEPPRRTSVYSAETGRLIPPPSRAMSRGFSRQRQRERDAFTHIVSDQDNEVLVLEMLCQILQTDSMAAVQSWLVSAGQREKDLVLDMITSAIATEETYYNQQNKQEYYEKREQTARPLTTEYNAPGPDANGHGEVPNMMNVQNGYGELDRPVPPSRDHQTNGYSRYNYSRDGERSKLGSAGRQLETIYDDQADHPSLRKTSSKPDIFKVHQSPRSQSKAEVMKIIHPPSPQKRSKSKQDSSTPPPQQTPNPSLATKDLPKVHYTKSALDIRDEDLKKHTLASLKKDES